MFGIPSSKETRYGFDKRGVRCIFKAYKCTSTPHFNFLLNVMWINSEKIESTIIKPTLAIINEDLSHARQI